MESGLSAVIGGIVGSTITLIGGKFLDIFILNKQNKFQLKKEYFLKKLNVFEKAAAYWTVTHSNFSNLAILIQVSHEEGTIINPEQQNLITLKLNKSLDMIVESTQEAAYSISLYLDIEEYEWEMAIGKEIASVISKINSLGSQINKIEDLFEDPSSKNHWEALKHSYNTTNEKLEMEVSKVIDLSNQIRQKLTGLIKNLKQELQQYN